MLVKLWAGLLALSTLALAHPQDGNTPAPGAGNTDPFATYKCDPNVCKLPKCHCASKNPPVSNPPMFVLLTHDDAIQEATWGPATALNANRKNPNGCPTGSTFFVSTLYSDPSLLTRWYAQNLEIASHTVTHTAPFTGTYPEIEGNRWWINSLGGIPRGQIKGFRHPFLNYNVESINLVAKMGFLYETSMSSQSHDMVWPYTLDYGAVNDCRNTVNVCGKELNASGLWEIPMAAIYDQTRGVQLMDPFNEPTPQNPTPMPTILQNYKIAFDARYTSTRAPFGVYVHPVWLGKAQPPTIPDGSAKLAMINEFLTYVQSKPDVWIVNNWQVIEYMKDPVPASEVGNKWYMQCTRDPAPPTNICNGLGNSSSLYESCPFAEGTFSTCYGCPASYPSLANPSSNSTSARCRLPDSCDTLYWDPVGCKCSCPEGGKCAYKDTGRPINMDQKSLDAWVKPAEEGGKKGSTSGVGRLRGSLVGGVLVGLVGVWSLM
ncbi:hypothetical protein HDV00_006049 [Rhizophlyctis rosea]|nr:hypothetical protein HDV00_006049 [Rhizophlyctis rosea]